MANTPIVIPTPLGNSNAQLIHGSTTFDRATSDYLSRSPSTDGNQRTWTVSWWFKLNETPGTGGASGQSFFIATTIPAEAPNIQIYLSDDLFIVNTRHDGGSWTSTKPANGFRDNSGWYHIVVAVDTTQATGTNRLKIYINGENISAWASDGRASITQDTDLNFNSTVTHCIGKQGTHSNVFADFNLSQFYIIDGQALGSESFGYTDRLTGNWRPKKLDIESLSSNDGKNWTTSGAVTGVSGWSQALAQGFNGSLSNAAEGNTYGETATISLGKKVTISAGGVGVYTWVTSGQPLVFELKLDGVVKETVNQGSSGGQWYFSSSYAGDIDSITVARTSRAPEWGAISINSQILTDDVGAWGVNGCYLPLDGTGYSAFQTAGNMVQDQSGNQNNWTSNGSPTFSLDSPSGVSNSVDTTAGITTTGFPSNYSTWNPLDCGDTVTLTKGRVRQEATTYDTSLVKSTFGMTAGKYYFEYNHVQKPSGGWSYIGVMDEMARTQGSSRADDLNYKFDKGWSYNSDGSVTHDDAETSYGTSWSNGDIIGCAFDVDQGKIWFSKNGTWQNSGNPETGANPAYSDIVTSTASFYGGRGNRVYVVATSIDTNTGTGIGELISGAEGFNYTAPKGFLPMCSNNNPAGVSNPSQYFKSVLYTGNNTSNPGNLNTISCGFQPDLVWIKDRGNTWPHLVFDTARGRRQDNADDSFWYWMTDSSSSPYQYGASGEHLRYFNGDGFVMGGASGYSNYNNNNYLAMAWKAGGGNINGSSGDEFWKDGKQYASAALADVGSGSVSPTACSVGTTPGLSILQYTGTGANLTIAHGLNKAPECMWIKGGGDCMVYHTDMDPTAPEDYFQNLNETMAKYNRTFTWNQTAPTDTLISLGTDSNLNTDGTKHILFAWHSVPGLSKFNHYMGNGNSDGNYVHCGFRPSFILIKKNEGTENWQIHTTAQNPRNSTSTGAGNRLFANTTAAESTQANLDILSDGFKMRTTDASVNSNGSTYLYMAWGEQSSSGQYGGQATGR